MKELLPASADIVVPTRLPATDYDREAVAATEGEK